jgi:hypothetical protein
MRRKSTIKSRVPARFFEEGIVTPILTKKIEETLDFAVILRRNRISTANSGLNLHETFYLTASILKQQLEVIDSVRQ